MKSRILSGLLLVALLVSLVLTGCSSSTTSFTWRVDAVPANLDPQLAVSSEERIAVTNLYRGLTRVNQEGDPVLDAAESYTVSDDGLVYTFVLNPEVQYTKLKKHEKEYPLTAHDFVFGIQRSLMPETESPYASLFLSIKGAKEYHAGTGNASQLGIYAKDDSTLVIELAEPDPEFLKKLSSPGAMPCNEEFFLASGGSYGLSARYTLANGWFYLFNWNQNGLFLRRNASGNRITSLRLVIHEDLDPTTSATSNSNVEKSSEMSATQLLDGEFANAAIGQPIESQSYYNMPFINQTWTLVFQPENTALSSQEVRKALLLSATTATLSLPSTLSQAEGLIPPTITVDGQSYREQAGSVLPSLSGDVRQLAQSGLASVGLSRFERIQILVPEKTDAAQLASILNQQWQKDLGAFSAYFSIKEVPMEELAAQLASGDYQIALVPFEASSDDGLAFLKQLPGCSSLGQSLTTTPSASQLKQLEQTALDSYTLYPLWYQEQALLVSSWAEGIVFNPFGPVLDLTWATSKE